MAYLNKKPTTISIAQIFIVFQIIIAILSIILIFAKSNHISSEKEFVVIINGVSIGLLLLTLLLIEKRKYYGAVIYTILSIIGLIMMLISTETFIVNDIAVRSIFSLIPITLLFVSDSSKYFKDIDLVFTLDNVNKDFLKKNKLILNDIIENNSSDNIIISSKLLFIEKNKYELISVILKGEYNDSEGTVIEYEGKKNTLYVKTLCNLNELLIDGWKCKLYIDDEVN